MNYRKMYRDLRKRKVVFYINESKSHLSYQNSQSKLSFILPHVSTHFYNGMVVNDQSRIIKRMEDRMELDKMLLSESPRDPNGIREPRGIYSTSQQRTSFGLLRPSNLQTRIEESIYSIEEEDDEVDNDNEEFREMLSNHH